MSLIDESWYVRPEKIKERRSAGGVVVRVDDAGDALVALSRGEDGFTDYILPKGGIEKGEDVLDAARREIQEEAGFTDLELLADLGTLERLSYDRARWIITQYYLFRTRETDPRPTDPNYDYAVDWFPLDALPEMVWPDQKELIRSNAERIRQLAEGSG